MSPRSDDIVLLPYSSGTTGLPKGVMVSNGSLVSHVLQMACDEFGYYDPPVSGMYILPCFIKRQHVSAHNI